MAKRVKKDEAPEPKAGATRPIYQIDVDEANAQTARKSLFFNFEDGNTIIRMLPQFNGSKTLFVESMLHNVLLKEDGEGKYAPGCLKYYKDEPCYVCQFMDWMMTKGVTLLTDDIEGLAARGKLTGQIFAQHRVSRKWEGPFLCAVPKSVATTMGAWLSMARDTGTKFFCDPDHGSNVAVSKTGKKLGTRYTATLVPRVEPLDEMIPGWTDNLILDLDVKIMSTITVLNMDEQKKALYRTFPGLPWGDIQKDIG